MSKALGTAVAGLLLHFLVMLSAAQTADAAENVNTRVPYVSGLGLDKAIAKLEQAGIDSSRLRYTRDAHPILKKRWRVCAQAPKAGTELGRSTVIVSIRRVCAAAFKKRAQQEVPYMRQFTEAEDWKTLAKAICDNYDTFSYGNLSKVVAAYIDKEAYEGEVDDLIRIGHRTNCREVKSTRF